MAIETEELFTPTMQRVQRIESLKPMSSGEILDLTTKAFREVGARVLRPTFGAAVLVYIAFMMMTQLLLPQLFYTKNPGNVFAQVGEVATAVVLGLTTALPIIVVGLSLIVTHSVHAVSDFMAGRIVHEVERQKRADRDLFRSIRLILRSLLLGFSGVLGTLALLLLSALLDQSANSDLAALSAGVAVFSGVVSFGVFVYVMIRHSLAPAALLLENLDPKGAARRSVQLLKGYRGAGAGDDSVVALSFIITLLALFLWGGIAFIYNITGVLQWLSAIVGRFWWGEVVVSLVSGIPYLIGFWLMVPIWSVGCTVIFYERRIRLEGYDIELLHHELAPKNRR